MAQGMVLMVVGMGTVFAFLILLVLAMQSAAAFFKKYAHLFPEKAAVPAKSAGADPAIAVAVALAAIRAKKRLI
jgi:Na+-transporting methylmalonyl-CoA/oxaloacetate decarboxylase gamma subunit